MSRKQYHVGESVVKVQYLSKVLFYSLISASFVACTGQESGPEIDMNNGDETPVWACRTEFGESHEATQQFWTALRADDKTSRNEVIESLAAAMELHPDEEIFPLLHGLASLWVVAEPLPEEDGDLGLQGLHAMNARASLEIAWELCPGDYRITAWLGPILINTGRFMQDEAMIEEGLAILDEGIANYPEFVLFSKLLTYADEDVNSPEFQNAFEAVRDNTSACAGDEVDSDAGVVIESNFEDPACSNHFRAAHNVEGSALFVGDVYLKAGDYETATRVYTQGLETSDAENWRYRSLLEERLDDLETFRSEAPERNNKDGRGWIWRSQVQCAVCHGAE